MGNLRGCSVFDELDAALDNLSTQLQPFILFILLSGTEAKYLFEQFNYFV